MKLIQAMGWKVSKGVSVRDGAVCSAGQGEEKGQTSSCCVKFEQHQVISIIIKA